MKISSLLTFTLPGVPSIFYGDEYGMENNDDSSRGCFDWKNYRNEIFEWYQKISRFRKLKVMKDGDINVLYSANGKFVFERVSKKERIIVFTNMKNTPLKIDLEGRYISLLNGKLKNSIMLQELEVEVLAEIK